MLDIVDFLKSDLPVKNYITEILDNPVPWKVVKSNEKNYEVEFLVKKIPYNFSALKIQNYWGLTFEADGNLDLTNTGNQFTVFSTVYDILKDFIRKYDPNIFFFSAKESSRRKLYKIFSEKISNEFGYNYNTKESGDQLYFNFTKL